MIPSDHVFPRFIVEGLPPGLSGLLLAAIFAAAMSTLSSSLNSLASSTVLDLVRPAANRERDGGYLQNCMANVQEYQDSA